VWVIAPISILGCLYLFYSLSAATIELFLLWAAVGLVVYYSYSRSRSHVGRGLNEVHEQDGDVPPGSVPPIN
jgi:APA family basic amino acid/polyamine antiporter